MFINEVKVSSMKIQDRGQYPLKIEDPQLGIVLSKWTFPGVLCQNNGSEFTSLFVQDLINPRVDIY